jgi:ABC-type transport system involved in cytochrome bd biosynthesis fused ATPase/permease subunit
MRKGILIAIVMGFVSMAIVATFSGCGEKVQEKAQTTYATEVQNLETALAGMQDPVTYDSVDNLQAAFSEVEAAFDDLVAAVEKESSANLTGLQKAFDSLEEAVANISSDESLQEKTDTLQAAAQDMSDALQQF